MSIESDKRRPLTFPLPLSMEIELANQRSFYVIKTRFESKIESPFYLIKFGDSHIVQTRDRQELIT